jgi:hypothetical protein
MVLLDEVRRTIKLALGPAADEVRVSCDRHGRVALAGTVEDEGARAAVLDAVAKADGVVRVDDGLEVKPDLAAEAGPKETEFAREPDARAMTGRELRGID